MEHIMSGQREDILELQCLVGKMQDITIVMDQTQMQQKQMEDQKQEMRQEQRPQSNQDAVDGTRRLTVVGSAVATSLTEVGGFYRGIGGIFSFGGYNGANNHSFYARGVAVCGAGL